MEKFKYSGKTIEEAKEIALKTLNCEEKDIYIKENEIKGGLFKAKKVEIEVVTKNQIIEEIKSFLTDILSTMKLDVKFEIKNRDEIPFITIFSDNNNILIGKQGRTVDAINTILKQYLRNELGFTFKYNLDVGEYKLKNQKRLEKLAKNIARDVIRTKMDIKLDPMNSYERRIIHTVLSEYKKVTTESIGEEPNRSVVIKFKEKTEEQA